MHKKRLLKLVRLLEKDAKNKKGIKFDLDVVAQHSRPGREDSWGVCSQQFIKGETPTLDCGTAACAVGLAAISGAFKREGFTYTITVHWGIEPKYKRTVGFGSAECRFFELRKEESEFLFGPDSYAGRMVGARGELRVAKRIRDFVAGKVAA